MTVNIPTVIICAVLVAIIGGIVWSLIRNKEKGKSSCGCGCASCAMKDACHPTKEKIEK